MQILQLTYTDPYRSDQPSKPIPNNLTASPRNRPPDRRQPMPSCHVVGLSCGNRRFVKSRFRA